MFTTGRIALLGLMFAQGISLIASEGLPNLSDNPLRNSGKKESLTIAVLALANKNPLSCSAEVRPEKRSPRAGNRCLSYSGSYLVVSNSNNNPSKYYADFPGVNFGGY